MTTTSTESPIDAEPAAVVSTARRRPVWIGLTVGLAALVIGLAVPSVVTDYYTMQLVLEVAILAMLALSIGFLAKHLGLISLGHTAFYGGAGYFAAIAATHWGWGPTSAALIGIAAGVLLALVMGLLVVRATGMGFLMLTLALGQALYQLSVQTSMRPITGAYDGLQFAFAVDGTFFGMSGQDVMNSSTFWKYVWGSLIISIMVLWWVGRSRFGTILEGVRENEERMRFSGYDTFMPRLAAFVLSGLIASVAGVLFTVHGSYVSPSMLGFVKAGDALIAAIIGGLGVLLGPVLGAALYIWAQSQFNDGGNLHLYTGIALIIVLVFLPGGILGGAKDLLTRFGRSRRKEKS